MKNQTLQNLENKIFDILKKELDANPVYGENGTRKQDFEFKEGVISAERYDSFNVIGDDFFEKEVDGFAEFTAINIEIYNSKNKLLKNISKFLTAKKINYDTN